MELDRRAAKRPPERFSPTAVPVEVLRRLGALLTDIANLQSTCTWNSDMYGVDMKKPGAQAYYDSVFQLFADWGVDYVKVDDISRPYHDNEAEIETVTNDVDAFDISPSGRRAVISVRGQILTIATDRGDITRVNPDKMASRSDNPKWSADGKDKDGKDQPWGGVTAHILTKQANGTYKIRLHTFN